MATRDYRLSRPPAAAVRARDCDRCTHGWLTFANEQTELGRIRADWIRRSSGLAYTELHTTAASALADGVTLPGEVDALTDPAASVAVFRFRGGQPCFQHPYPFRFLAGSREHKYLDDWIEDLDEHVGRLTDQAKRG